MAVRSIRKGPYIDYHLVAKVVKATKVMIVVLLKHGHAEQQSSLKLLV